MTSSGWASSPQCQNFENDFNFLKILYLQQFKNMYSFVNNFGSLDWIWNPGKILVKSGVSHFPPASLSYLLVDVLGSLNQLQLEKRASIWCEIRLVKFWDCFKQGARGRYCFYSTFCTVLHLTFTVQRNFKESW